MLSYAGIDPLNPDTTEFPFLLFSIAVSIHQPFFNGVLATVHTFFLRPKNPLANFMMRLRLALEATLFTDLGICFHFLVVGDHVLRGS